jgi:hypothetical protein
MNTITVVNPRGQFPALQQAPMALRLDSLDKKTIYIVDVRWPYTHQFAEEMCHVLSERYPNTKFIVMEKTGSYMEDDSKLWAEIQEQGNGAILTVGH